MKKLRYSEKFRTPTWLRIVYFVTAWNVFGISVYYLFSRNEEKKDSTWKNLTGTQKYLRLIGFGSTTNMKVIKVKNMASVETETMTSDELKGYSSKV